MTLTSAVAHPFLVSQLFGILAAVMSVFRFKQAERRKFLLWAIPTNLPIIVSMALLGQWQGVAIVAGTTSSSTAQSFLGSNAQHMRWIRLGLGVAFGLLGVWLCPPTQIWITWLPVVAYSLGRLGETQNNFLRLRLILLAATTVYLIYNLLSFNLAIAFMEVIVFAQSVRVILPLLRPATDPVLS